MFQSIGIGSLRHIKLDKFFNTHKGFLKFQFLSFQINYRVFQCTCFDLEPQIHIVGIFWFLKTSFWGNYFIPKNRCKFIIPNGKALLTGLKSNFTLH